MTKGTPFGLATWASFGRHRPGVDAGRLPRICFLFNAQLHQLMHGITTAAALAASGRAEVHVLCASDRALGYAREVVARLGGAPIQFALAGPRPFHALARVSGRATPPKLLTLAALVPKLDRFDAIAIPERTSLTLKKMGVTRPRFIHLDHGAGDRAISADPRIAQFDFVMLAGEKQRDRFQREGLIRPGGSAIVGYPKFDAADAMRDPAWRPFANDRPTVLYNPHFSQLGSWDAWGRRILDAFARQDRYNLIFAPHVRLFDGAGPVPEFDRYRALPHMRIDLGSDRSVDMSYTGIADIYLGDVSSQIYEFIRTPRPCLFLDHRARDWRGDENYGHWALGPVATDIGDPIGAVDCAVARFPAFVGEQRRRFADTFDLTAHRSSDRAALAIATYLDRIVAPRTEAAPAAFQPLSA
ncbi:hypothetical protein PQ455_14245 [Sphingomonas naphthae]|uniref:Glycosyl transferase n=1 Tax=Sphingomonas naphthae TaxID=1813468 RepID=A0ABY7THS9_9SPHN|nr:hypothetical protein [Sphingomonas naphthae]WCT72787.1 hypothetical protein PQ455_14245 [Sphingomonas naphthae]